MTLIVAIIMAGLFWAGAVLLRRTSFEHPLMSNPQRCDRCGTVNPDVARFCGHCGQAFSHA